MPFPLPAQPFSPAFIGAAAANLAPVDVITLRSRGGTTGYAPSGFIFEVDFPYGALNDPRSFFDLHHVWNFGDATDTFDSVTLPSPLTNARNTMTGSVAAHVYETAGTLTATCKLYDSSGTLRAQGSISVTVESQESYFGQSNTIVYSQAGNFTGAPAAAHQITTLAALHAQVDAWRNRNRVRVLLRRGEVITLDSANGGSLWINDNSQGALVGSFGDAADARPEIRLDGPTNTTSSRALEFGSGTVGLTARYTVTDVHLNGRYDPVTPTYPAGVRPMNGIVFRCEHGLIHKVSASNTNIAFQGLTNVELGEMIISDCTVDGWSDYGALISARRSAVIGCSIKQNTNVATGVAGKGLSTNFYSDHGPVRCSGVDPSGDFAHRHVSYANDLWTKGGWSGAVTGTANQPCLRLLGDASSNFRINVSNNRMEGGDEVLTLSTHAGNAAHFSGLALVQGNVLLGDERTQNFIRIGRYGIEIRSNVMIKPNVAQVDGTLNRFLTFEVPTNTTVPSHVDGRPNKFYNNTLINEQSSANAGNLAIQTHTIEGGPEPSGSLVVGDNILSAPGASNAGSLTDYSPLDSAAFYRPQTGSAALSGATLALAPVDFALSYRASSTSIGAWKDTA